MIALALAFSVHTYGYEDDDCWAFRWLNYETGEELHDSLVSELAKRPIFTFSEDDRGIICEVTIKYARIQKIHEYDGVYMEWTLPTFSSTWQSLGEPEVPYKAVLFMLDSECDSVNIFIEDAEYKEFDYILPPNQHNECDTRSKVNAVKPFKNLLTEGKGLSHKIIQSCSLKKYEDGTTFVQVFLFPVQYNYDRQVVRAYSYIKMRVAPVNTTGVKKPTASRTYPTVCYDLQGRKATQMQKGQVYIEKEGENVVKKFGTE